MLRGQIRSNFQTLQKSNLASSVADEAANSRSSSRASSRGPESPARLADADVSPAPTRAAAAQRDERALASKKNATADTSRAVAKPSASAAPAPKLPIAIVCFDDTNHRYPVKAGTLTELQRNVRALMVNIGRLRATDSREPDVVPWPDGSFSDALRTDNDLRHLFSDAQKASARLPAVTGLMPPARPLSMPRPTSASGRLSVDGDSAAEASYESDDSPPAKPAVKKATRPIHRGDDVDAKLEARAKRKHPPPAARAAEEEAAGEKPAPAAPMPVTKQEAPEPAAEPVKSAKSASVPRARDAGGVTGDLARLRDDEQPPVDAKAELSRLKRELEREEAQDKKKKTAAVPVAKAEEEAATVEPTATRAPSPPAQAAATTHVDTSKEPRSPPRAVTRDPRIATTSFGSPAPGEGAAWQGKFRYPGANRATIADIRLEAMDRFIVARGADAFNDEAQDDGLEITLRDAATGRALLLSRDVRRAAENSDSADSSILVEAFVYRAPTPVKKRATPVERKKAVPVPRREALDLGASSSPDVAPVRISPGRDEIRAGPGSPRSGPWEPAQDKSPLRRAGSAMPDDSHRHKAVPAPAAEFAEEEEEEEERYRGDVGYLRSRELLTSEGSDGSPSRQPRVPKPTRAEMWTSGSELPRSVGDPQQAKPAPAAPAPEEGYPTQHRLPAESDAASFAPLGMAHSGPALAMNAPHHDADRSIAGRKSRPESAGPQYGAASSSQLNRDPYPTPPMPTLPQDPAPAPQLADRMPERSSRVPQPSGPQLGGQPSRNELRPLSYDGVDTGEVDKSVSPRRRHGPWGAGRGIHTAEPTSPPPDPPHRGGSRLGARTSTPADEAPGGRASVRIPVRCNGTWADLRLAISRHPPLRDIVLQALTLFDTPENAQKLLPQAKLSYTRQGLGSAASRSVVQLTEDHNLAGLVWEALERERTHASLRDMQLTLTVDTGVVVFDERTSLHIETPRLRPSW